MARRDKRQKASDVFNETEFVFGRKVGFDEAFPQIHDVVVEVRERGDGVRRSTKRVYRKPHIGEYIDCSNPVCYNGGFPIGRILRQMVKNRQTELETTERCQGYEGSPKGRRRYRDCFNSFEVRVSIEYTETIPSDQS
ncbi:MAG: hypothetical protein ACOC6F_00250 [bacterium]